MTTETSFQDGGTMRRISPRCAVRQQGHHRAAALLAAMLFSCGLFSCGLLATASAQVILPPNTGTDWEREHFVRLLVRNRAANDLAAALQTALYDRQIDAAANHARRLLERAEDSFVEVDTPEGRGWRPTSQWIEGLLRTRPALLAAFERQFSRAGDQLLQDAASPLSNVARYRLAMRRYPTTAAGAQAAIWWTALELDRGNADVAQSLLKMARAGAAGKVTESQSPVERLQRLSDLMVERDQSKSSGNRDWPVVGGDTGRTRLATTQAPLRWRLWGHPWLAAEEGLPEDHDYLARWHTAVARNDEPPLASVFPIVNEGLVVYRSPWHVIARHVSTGQLAWQWKTSTAWLDDLRNDPSHVLNPADRNNGERPDPGTAWGSRPLWGTLTSNNTHVFAVDVATRPLGDDSARAANRRHDFAARTRVVALPLLVEGPATPAWIIESGRAPFTDELLLGPPTPVGERLYVQTRSSDAQYVSELDPRTGDRLWKQPIGFDPQFRVRSLTPEVGMVYAPLVANNLLVCTTPHGQVTAVDALTGRLEWSAMAGRPDSQAFLSESTIRWPSLGGFGPAVVMAGETVIVATPQFDQISALALSNGGVRWRISANSTALSYVAGANRRAVFMVGPQRVLAFAIETGELLWEWSDPTFVPAGRGVMTATSLVLPARERGWIELDMKTGVPLGARLALRTSPTGHLTPCGSLLITADASGIACYPTRSEVEQLAEEAASPHRIRAKNSLWEAAYLRGDIATARQMLGELVADAGTDVPRADDVREAYRETLYASLRLDPKSSAGILQELERIASDPHDRGRYLVARAQWEQQHGSAMAFRVAAEGLLKFSEHRLVPSADDPNHLLAPVVWHRRLVAARDGAGDAQDRDWEWGTLIRPELRYAGGLSERQGNVLYEQLRQRLRAAGRLDAVEQLLREQAAGDVEVERELVQLLEDCGFYDEAADVLAKWPEETAHREVAARPQAISGQLWTRRRWPTSTEYRLATVHQRPRRQKLVIHRDTLRADRQGGFFAETSAEPTPLGQSSVELRGAVAGQGGWRVINRPTASQVLAQASGVPMRSPEAWPFAHLALVAQQQQLTAFSLLEESTAWQITPPRQRLTHLKVGAARSGLAILVQPGMVGAIDPITGQWLWQRFDPRMQWGQRYASDMGGVILYGSDVLLLAPTLDRYFVLDAVTGETRADFLLAAGMSQSWAMTRGHALIHLSDLPSQQRCWMVYDLRTRTLVEYVSLPDTVGSRQNHVRIQSPFLVAVEGRSNNFVGMDEHDNIFEIDTETLQRRVVIPAPSDAQGGVGQLTAVADETTLYVSRQRTRSLATRGRQRPVDIWIPRQIVQDELFAIDRFSGQIRWHTPISLCALLSPEAHGGPCLILVTQLQEPTSPPQRRHVVQLLDRKTGLQVGRTGSLQSDVLVFADCDGAEQQIVLTGASLETRLQLRPRGAQDDPAAYLSVPLHDSFEP